MTAGLDIIFSVTSGFSITSTQTTSNTKTESDSYTQSFTDSSTVNVSPGQCVEAKQELEVNTFHMDYSTDMCLTNYFQVNYGG